jgi:hypothetical protein
MNKREREHLLAEAAAFRGRRKHRYVDETEVDLMSKLDRKSSLRGKTIRVYSVEGFVPHSYKWRANIDYVERGYTEDGKKYFYIGQTDAHRSHSRGATITVNKRAYDL